MSEITDAMLYDLTDQDGQRIDVVADLNKIYKDELNLVQRPSVMKRIGITAAGIAGKLYIITTETVS